MQKIYLLNPEQVAQKSTYGVVRENGEGIASFQVEKPEEVEQIIKDLEKMLKEQVDDGKEEFKIVHLGDDEMTLTELLRRNLEWDMIEYEKKKKCTEEENEIRQAITQIDPEIFNRIKIQVNNDSTRHGDFSINFYPIAHEVSKILNKKIPVEKVTEVFYKLLTQ